jgi:tRNA threonylcarbamoyladenosine biosynthesis protein TsaB
LSVLFIDSSYDITLGLLNESLEWFDFRVFKGQRASSTLQTETYKLLQDFSKKMSELKGVVTVAGPGFYTGLRLSEGFSDVTTFFQIPHYSFYSYEIPAMIGINSGTWMTKAYRGEYFIYEWSHGVGSSRLLEAKDLSALSALSDTFIHSVTSLDEKLAPFAVNAKSTADILKNNSQKIFQNIINNKLDRESFYFRAPEDEFRMNP